MSIFMEDLFERLERELATLEARVALDKNVRHKEIKGYLDIMALWAFSSRALGEPWSESVQERTRQLEQCLQEGCPLGQVHVRIMELLIDVSRHLYSTRKGMPPVISPVSSGSPLRASEKSILFKATCTR